MKALILILAVIGSTAFANGILIKNATLIDPATKSAFSGHIEIRNGLIKKIYQTAVAPKLVSVKSIDAAGKYVIPGLHDMHVHNYGDNMPPRGAFQAGFHDFSTQETVGLRYLYSGVTTYLDLHAPNDISDDPAGSAKEGGNIFDLRTREQKGDIVHPHLYVAGPIFVMKGTHGVAGKPDAITFLMRDEKGQLYNDDQLKAVAADAAAKVKHVIEARHPDVIKFVYNITEDIPGKEELADMQMPDVVAKAIIDAAQAGGVKTVAHVGNWQGLKNLAQMGVSAITHLPSGAPPADVVEEMLKNRVTVIPTIAIFNDYGDMNDDAKRLAFMEADLFKLLTPVSFAATYLDPKAYDEKEKAWVVWGEKHNQMHSQALAVKALFDAGVPIVAGTDSGNSGAVHGYSLHRELVQMEEAGLDRWSILQTATVNASDFVQQPAGRLKKGYIADLVILNADPLKSIANTQKINAVILKGELMPREDWVLTR